MKPELLAPAGSYEGLIAAVRGGADAVYFGAGKHNARRGIAAITFGNTPGGHSPYGADSYGIRAVAEYCHARGVKAYLALNTLIKDAELAETLELAGAAYRNKIDAVIIQDTGLARLIKDKYPDIVLHASTQMGVHNLQGALAAKDLGIDRVILSRETELNDIKEISGVPGLETEVFIHGANCVSFSGNCYFSSLASGFSGNRGRCMQLCRKKYAPVIDGKTREEAYLLSIKDNCLIGSLKDLCDAGVTSFKIEGRLRRPEYTAGTVSVYRRVIDNGFCYDNNDIKILKELFNRGNYIQGHAFSDGNCAMVDKFFPAHIGVKTGKVETVAGSNFSYSGEQLNKGDGIKFIRGNTETGNAEITNPDKLTFKGDIKPGDIIMRTTNAALISGFNSLPERKIIINAYASVNDNSLYIKINYKKLAVDGEISGETAVNNPLTTEGLTELLNKTDNYPFSLKLTADIKKTVFFQKSALNALRRDLFDRLYNMIIAGYEPAVSVNEIKNPYITANISVPHIFNINRLEQLGGININENDIISLSPDDYNNIDIKKLNNRIFLNLPVIANREDIKLLESSIKKFDGVIANNIYGVKLSEKYKIPFIAGTGMNVFNNSSGYINYIQSAELNKHETLTLGNVFIYAFGRLPFMTMTVCPAKVNGYNCGNCKTGIEYKDKFGLMPVKRIKISRCYHQLINSLPVDIIDKTAGLRQYIDLNGFNNKECAVIVNCVYNKTNTPYRHTSGHYNRGVE